MDRCKKCACTDEKPCLIDGLPCRWVNGKHNKCSRCFTEEGNPINGFIYGRNKRRKRSGKRS